MRSFPDAGGKEENGQRSKLGQLIEMTYPRLSPEREQADMQWHVLGAPSSLWVVHQLSVRESSVVPLPISPGHLSTDTFNFHAQVDDSCLMPPSTLSTPSSDGNTAVPQGKVCVFSVSLGGTTIHPVTISKVVLLPPPVALKPQSSHRWIPDSPTLWQPT